MLSSKKWLLGLMGVILSLGLMGATKCDVQAADYQVGSYIVCNTDTRLFTLPDCNEGVVAEISKNSVCTIVENDDIYTLVSCDGVTGYLYQEYIGYDEAIIAAYQAELLARSEEVRLLAALIQCEAGGEPIEGQIAVGSVVMNRVKSPSYPNTIADVIHAPGQFTPAGSGKVAELMASNNIKDCCREAAKAAFQGMDMVGGLTHFRRAGSKEGIIIGNHVFY